MPFSREGPCGQLPSIAGPHVEHTQSILDRQASHVSSLLDGLLDVSRIIRGRFGSIRSSSTLACKGSLFTVRLPISSAPGDTSARSITRRIPLIAVSGYGRPDDKTRAGEAGFDAHVTKPIDLKTLKRLLADFRSGN